MLLFFHEIKSICVKIMLIVCGFVIYFYNTLCTTLCQHIYKKPFMFHIFFIFTHATLRNYLFILIYALPYATMYSPNKKVL